MNPFILLSAAAVGGLYLLNVPLVAALAAGCGVVGWSLGVFVPTGALRRAERSAAGLGRQSRKRTRRPPLRTVLAPARYLLRHTRLLFLSFSGVLSTGDALRTALAVGTLNALGAIPGLRVVSRVRPDFSGAPARVEAEAAVVIPLGRVLAAAVLWARELLRVKHRFETAKAAHPVGRKPIKRGKTLKERIIAWKSSQSKA